MAQLWALTVGAAVFTALLGVSVWHLAQGEMLEAAGWFANSIMALLFFFTDYLQVTYRTARDFARIALVRVVQQVALLALVVLVVPLDFYGLCFRVVLAGALNVALLYRGRPVRVGPRWNTQHLRHLLKVGLPMFLVFQIFIYWEVVDRTLVLRLGGTRMMGLYSMVILAMAAVQTIPGAVGQVLYPRMSEQYGRGRSLREVARGIAKPIVAIAIAVIPVIAVGWWLAEPLTRVLVPEYVDAVPAIQWALPICFIRCFESAYALFSVGRRQRLRLVGVSSGVVVYGGSLLLLIHDGVYLAAFPQAMLIGRTVCLFVSFAMILLMLAREPDSGPSVA